MPSRTRSRQRRTADLSPEVVWYLESRGYELPDAAPLIRTPEPRSVKGAVFDPDRVDRVITALRCLRHTKGKWAGTPLEPDPWQVAYVIAPVFGWAAPDEAGDMVRVIRDVYVEVPRKNGKTTLMSGLAMVLGFADGEPGAEVLLGAASKDQAGQAFGPLKAVASASKILRDAGVRPLQSKIVQDASDSVVKVVSSRGDLAHGAHVHGGLVDELHVHRSPDLLEAIESGTGARSQPLVAIITTADDGQTTSVYAQRRHLIEQIAAGVIKAPAMYGVVFAAEEHDDPFAESTWRKANPGYPKTPTPAFMRQAADKAKAAPTALASYLRLHLGIRAKQDKRFIDLGRWDRNASMVDEQGLSGRRAFGGLDLGSTSDLTALAWLFPAEVGYDVLWRFWLPEAALGELDARTHRTASTWVKAGHLTLTPGDVTDYDFVKATITKDMGRFDVQSIGFDRWNSTQAVIDLEAEGAPMMKVGQGFTSLSAPLKEIDRLVRLGTPQSPMLRHAGNPVARWMADNLRVAMDAAGNIKPDKAKSMDKIDGFSALTTAMAVAMTAEPVIRSAYEDGHGLEVV